MAEYEYLPVAPRDEIPLGERIYLELDGKSVVVFNVGGTFYAIGDVCTHDNGPLGDGELDGHQIICPRHGARFDLSSGKALTRPAVNPAPFYPTRVVDGIVEIGLPIK